MSNKKSNSALLSTLIKEFDGINTGAKYKHPLGSSQVVNFRIDENGSLRKRCGFKHLTTLPYHVNAVWYGKLEKYTRLIILSGFSVYEYRNSQLREIGYIDNLDYEQASFFFYLGNLYLMDGHSLFAVHSNSVSKADCYAPLIGKDWVCGWKGDPYEKRNLLSDLVRITYVADHAAIKYLRVTDTVKEVVSLYRNGELLSPDEYTIDNTNKLIFISEAEPDDVFELTVRYPAMNSTASNDIRTSLNCTILGGIEGKQPHFWNTQAGNVLYVGKQLSAEQISASQIDLPCAPIYVTDDDILRVGNGNHKIMALAKHFGRTLIFTENDVWRTSEEGQSKLEANPLDTKISDMQTLTINTSIGVSSTGGVILADNDPISIGKSALFRWTANTDELDEQNAYPISTEIQSQIPEEFWTSGSLFFDKYHNEIYFYAKEYDKVWIWNKSAKKWVRFEGFEPEILFEYEENVAFAGGNDIYVFDESQTTDLRDSYESDIIARFCSNPIDFGTFEDKHITSISASAEGGEINFNLYFDDNITPDISLSAAPEKTRHIIRRRISGKRFKCVQVEIIAGGQNRQALHSLKLESR